MPADSASFETLSSSLHPIIQITNKSRFENYEPLVPVVCIKLLQVQCDYF